MCKIDTLFIDVLEVGLPEGQLSVHTHLWCGGRAVRLGAAQLQMGKLNWKSRVWRASFQRWQQFSFGWTTEYRKERHRNSIELFRSSSFVNNNIK